MEDSITDFIFDMDPVRRYYDQRQRHGTVKAVGMEDFTVAADSQSNLDEFSHMPLRMLDEECTQALIKTLPFPEEEPLSSYWNSQGCCAISPPEPVPKVPNMIFPHETHEHQQERQSAREVVPLEDIYALLAEESQVTNNLQIQTIGPLMQPNASTTGNDWQSGNYMYGSKTPLPTTTSSNATISNNQQYDFPLDMNLRPLEFSYSGADVTRSSHARYQNSTAVCKGEPIIPIRTLIPPFSFPHSVSPVSQDVHASERSIPTATSSNAIVSPKHQNYCSSDTNLRPSEFVHSMSDVTGPSYARKRSSLCMDKHTIIINPHSSSFSVPQSVSQRTHASETSFHTAMSQNDAIVSLHQQTDDCLFDMNSQPCDFGYSHVTGPFLERSVAVDTNYLMMLLGRPPVTIAQSLPQSIQSNGVNLVMDTRNISLHFPKDDAKGVNCTKSKYFMCPYCSYSTSVSTNLKNHVMIHTGEKPHECNICKKKFIRKVSLQTHIRKHTGEKSHTCNICGKGFTSKWYLKEHINIHTGEKPYACNVCNKMFTQKSTLAMHFRIHTAEKPYACNICEKRFRRKCNLNIHVRTHTVQRS